MPAREVAIEEILIASASQRTIKAPLCDHTHLMLKTGPGITLGPQDESRITELIGYVNKKYRVEMRPIGGGYACTKINFVVEGIYSAVDLAKLLAKDPKFIEDAKAVGIDFVISVENINVVGKDDSDDDPEDPPDPPPDKSGGPGSDATKRVSSDGSIQKTKKK